MAEQEKALITIEKTQVAAVFVKGGLDPFIEKIKAEVAGFKGDLNTAKGRGEITSLAFKVVKSKTLLQKAGHSLLKQKKEEISGATKQIDAIRAEGKRMTTELDLISNKIRQPLTEWKEAEEEKKKAEEERIEAIQGNINGIKNYLPLGADGSFCQLHLASSEQLETVIQKLKGLDLSTFKEFEEEATQVWNDKITELESVFEFAKDKELVATEKKRLADEEKARQQKIRDVEIADKAKETERLRLERKAQKERDDIKEKETRAKLETERLEQEKIDTAGRVEREKKEALDKAERDKREALEVERLRIKAIDDAKIKADKERAANTEHRLKIKIEIFQALVLAGLDEEVAANLFDLLSSGKLPNVSINY